MTDDAKNMLKKEISTVKTGNRKQMVFSNVFTLFLQAHAAEC